MLHYKSVSTELLELLTKLMNEEEFNNFIKEKILKSQCLNTLKKD